jgi:hypothetical protein
MMNRATFLAKNKLVIAGILLLIFSSVADWITASLFSSSQSYGILLPIICMVILKLSLLSGIVLLLIGLFLIFRDKYPLKSLTYICIAGIIVGGVLMSGGLWLKVLKQIIFTAAGDYRIPIVSPLFVRVILVFHVFGWIGIPLLVASVIGLIYCAGKSRSFLSKLRLSLPCHDGVLVTILGCVSAFSGPLTYYLITYFAGWGIFPWGLGFVFLLLIFGSGVSLICFFFLRQLIRTTRNTHHIYTIIVAILVFVAHYMIILGFMLPVGPIWTNGFVAGITSRVDLDALQSWAMDRLFDYQEGTLKIGGEPEYWSPAKEELDPSIIPEYIQNMWATPPSVGIVTPDHTTIGDYCMTISWYGFGILVGEPAFQSQWKPRDLRELQPGIFVYRIEK